VWSVWVLRDPPQRRKEHKVDGTISRYCQEENQEGRCFGFKNVRQLFGQRADMRSGNEANVLVVNHPAEAVKMPSVTMSASLADACTLEIAAIAVGRASSGI
jgi:hypothetical protein